MIPYLKRRPKELTAYLEERATSRRRTDPRIGDRAGVVRIGDMFGLSAETVRDELYHQGWRREPMGASGLKLWRPPKKQRSD